jgi:alpha-maltose-1-phosphate synthase
MKALILTNEYPPHVYGGAGVHVEYLVRELARRLEIEVRCFGEQSLVSGPLTVRGYAPASELLVGAPEELRPTLATLQRGLAFTVEPAQADVVHCHTWYAHFPGILHRLLYGTPLVITIHSLEPLRPWKREQLGRGYDLSSWVERTALEMADAIVAVSRDTRQDVLDHFRVDPERICIIPNGIDVDEYRHDPATDHLTRYGIPEDRPYVLFVGRVTRQKGIIHLLRAIERFDPGIAVVLCAGAPDTPEIAREMERRVRDLEREREHVYWIEEMVPRKAAIQLYSHAALFCCPSVYEPFGIINLEAMACRTPVVASAVGGIKEVVLHEETGLLVSFERREDGSSEPRDPERFAADLAAAVNRLMADPANRERMAEAGRRRVEEHYAWSAVAAQVETLYRRLVAGGPSR